MSQFQFSNVVVVEERKIGVIVKSWKDGNHEVYVRCHNQTIQYHESKIKHFVYSKFIHDDEREFYDS